MPKPLKISKEQLEPLLNEGLSYTECAKKLACDMGAISNAAKKYGLKSQYALGSPTRNKKLGQKRREWLSKNPDKHAWRKADKFKSAPCQKVKDWLSIRGIAFISEFQPALQEKRYYSLDIAFPEKKIGIEINGNQHYGPDGKLKPYYQKRHDLIESLGWKLYELHYSICFKIADLADMLKQILSSEVKIDFNYDEYIAERKYYQALTPSQRKAYRNGGPVQTSTGNAELEVPNDVQFHHRAEKQMLLPLQYKESKQYRCSDCGGPIRTNSPRCVKCTQLRARKVERPSPEKLYELVWSMSSLALAKHLGVSDSIIVKWCRQYNISKPPRGYWNKRAAGMSREEALALPTPKTKQPIHIITPIILQDIIALRRQGKKWTAIGKIVGFNRHNVKRAYMKWFEQQNKMAQSVEVAST